MAFKLGNPGCPCCDEDESSESFPSSSSSVLLCPCANGNIKRVATAVYTDVSGVIDQTMTAFYTYTRTGTADCDTFVSEASLINSQDSKVNGTYKWILYYKFGQIGERLATSDEIAALEALVPADIDSCDTTYWEDFTHVMPRYSETALGMTGEVRAQGYRNRIDCAPNPDGGNTIDALIRTYSGAVQRVAGTSIQFAYINVPIAVVPNNAGIGTPSTSGNSSTLALTSTEITALGGFSSLPETRIPVVTCDYTTDEVTKSLVDWVPHNTESNYNVPYSSPATGYRSGVTALQSPSLRVRVVRL